MPGSLMLKIDVYKRQIKAQGSSTLLLTDCAPNAQMVKLTFPARPTPKRSKMTYPEVEVIWYDGGLQPAKPAGWPAGKNMNNAGGGAIFHGTKDKPVSYTHLDVYKRQVGGCRKS